jgi:carboxypeptidase family protein
VGARGGLLALVGLGALLLGLLAYLRPRAGHGEDEGHAASSATLRAGALEVPEHVPEVTPPPDTPPAAASEPSTADPLAPAPRARPAAALSILSGRVTDADHAPIQGWDPVVVLLDARCEAREVECDDEGRYALPGLAAGRWTVRGEAVGYRTHEEVLELDGTNVRLDLALERTPRLLVRLTTPNGEPFVRATRDVPGLGLLRFELRVEAREGQGAELKPRVLGVGDFSMSAARWCGDSLSSTCIANDAGLATYWRTRPVAVDLGADGIGVLVLEREPPLYVHLLRGDELLASERVGTGSTEVRFTLDPAALAERCAALRLRAVDAAAGEPLTGTVKLRNASLDAREYPLDGDGRLALDGLPGGWTELRFAVAEHESLPRALTLRAGETLDLGDVALVREQCIEALVLDGEGRPLAASFAIGTFEEQGLRFLADVHTSDPDGRLSIGRLRPGRYALRTTDDGAAQPGETRRWALPVIEMNSVERLAAEAPEPVELRLVPATELVLLGTHALAPGTTFGLRAGGHELFRGPFVVGWLPRFFLAPGAYELELLAPDGERQATHALTLAGARRELDLGG